MSEVKEFSEIKSYKEIRKIYLNTLWTQKRPKQEKKNIENRKELEKEIKEMILMNSLITKAEIKKMSNFKYIENEKYYLSDLIKISFCDYLNKPLKVVEHIISKREINPNEYKKYNFKSNIMVLDQERKKEEKSKEGEENCLLI